METLIKKVEAIEQEAAALIEQARAEGSAALSKVTTSEESFLHEVTRQAESRAQAIVKERVKKAQDLVHATHQDDSASTKMVHEAAKANGSHAVALAVSLFDSEYLAS